MHKQFIRRLPDYVCPACGKGFRPINARTKFCSQDCSHAGRSRDYVIPLETRLFLNVNQTDIGCWLRTDRIMPNGYTAIGQRAKTNYAHRVALELALGMPIPKGFQSLHACDVRNCIRNDDPGIYVIRGIARPRFGHLWLGTQADNVADTRDKGRVKLSHNYRPPRGEDSVLAKLNNVTVAEIRHRYSQGGVTQQRLADQFGVSMGLIHLVVTRQRYLPD